MPNSFPHLFSPIAIGPYTLKNRIMNTGHAAHFQTGDGLPTQRYVDYVGERAKGGVGIVVTGHTVPHYDGDVSLSLASYDDRIVPMYQRMAAATHAHDVPLLAQLGHRGRRVADGAAFLQRPSIAPSAVPPPDFSAPQLVPHAMTVAEIEETLDQFSAAARRAIAGDLDGIELSIGMDYLFPNFLNAQSNRREDRYGGATLEERMTFTYETVDALRDAIGRERILGIRMYDDLEDWGLKLDDYKQVARLLEAHGRVDYFNMWQGIVPTPRSGRAHWPAHYYAPGRVRAPAARHQGVRVAARGRDRAAGLARGGGAVHRRRHRRPRRDGAGAHRRPAPAEQGPRGPHRRHPHLHRLHPELRRTHLRRDGRRVHLQPGHGGARANGRCCPRPRNAARSWLSEAGRRGWRRRASRPNAGTRSCCSSAGLASEAR